MAANKADMAGLGAAARRYFCVRLWKRIGANAAQNAAPCGRFCEREPKDGEYSGGRFLHIPGKRERRKQFKRDVGGEWDEWRVCRGRHDRCKWEIFCADQSAQSELGNRDGDERGRHDEKREQ